MKRDFPTAVDYGTALKDCRTRWLKQLSANQRLALALATGSNADNYRLLDPTRIDDPELSKASRIARLAIDEKLVERYRLCDAAGMTRISDPLSRYRLAMPGSTYRNPSEEELSHYYLYLNAVYAANRKELKNVA